MLFKATNPYNMKVTLSQAAKLNPLGLGRNRFIEMLQKHRFLMSDGSPMQRYIDRNYFVFEVEPIYNKKGILIKHVPVVKVTLKGLNCLERHFLNFIKKQNP